MLASNAISNIIIAFHGQKKKNSGPYVFFLLNYLTYPNSGMVQVISAIICSKSEITYTSLLLSHRAILIDTHIVKG